MLRFAFLLALALRCGANHLLTDYQVKLLNTSVVRAAQTPQSVAFAVPSCEISTIAGTMLNIFVTPNTTGVEVIVGQVAVPGCRVARAVSGQVVSGNDGKGPGIPVPSGVAYRVTGLTPSTSYSVVLRHPTSGVQSVPGILSTANVRTPRSAVDAEAFSRSGGMVVITVILSVLIFLLIAILVAALLLGNKN
ncbi:uroplakin-2-like [Lethenteron reissneri]|uniref:uroplakin-2-like n=1 Tax=Lethenteron reissneri TaxID=7753 RepID=UPI002AB77465|nr:uroplakin-2-like [Lethenteron reissneri]